MEVITGTFNDASSHKNLSYDFTEEGLNGKSDTPNNLEEDQQKEYGNGVYSNACDIVEENGEEVLRFQGDGMDERKKCYSSDQSPRVKRKKLRFAIVDHKNNGDDGCTTNKRKDLTNSSQQRVRNLIRSPSSKLRTKLKIGKIIESDTNWFNKSQNETKCSNNRSNTSCTSELTSEIDLRSPFNYNTKDDTLNKIRNQYLNNTLHVPEVRDTQILSAQTSSLSQFNYNNTEELHINEFSGISQIKSPTRSFRLSSELSSSGLKGVNETELNPHHRISFTQERGNRHQIARSNDLRGCLQNRKSKNQYYLSNLDQDSRQYHTVRCCSKDRTRDLLNDKLVSVKNLQPCYSSQKSIVNGSTSHSLSSGKLYNRKVDKPSRYSEGCVAQSHNTIGVAGRTSFDVRRHANSNLRLRISNGTDDKVMKNTNSVDKITISTNNFPSATTSSVFSPMSSPFLQVSLLDSPLFENSSAEYASNGNEYYLDSPSPCTEEYKIQQTNPSSCNNVSSLSDAMVRITSSPTPEISQRTSDELLNVKNSGYYYASSSVRNDTIARLPRGSHQVTALPTPRYCYCNEPPIYPRSRYITIDKNTQVRSHRNMLYRVHRNSGSCSCQFSSLKYSTNTQSALFTNPYKPLSPHSHEDCLCECQSNSHLRISSTCCGKRRSDYLLSAALGGWQQKLLKRNSIFNSNICLDSTDDNYPIEHNSCNNFRDPVSCKSYSLSSNYTTAKSFDCEIGASYESANNNRSQRDNLERQNTPAISNLDPEDYEFIDGVSPSIITAPLHNIEARESYNPNNFKFLLCNQTFRNRYTAIEFVKLKSALYGFKSHIRTSKNDSIVFMCNRRRRTSKNKNLSNNSTPSQGNHDCSWRIVTSKNKIGYWIFKPTGNFNHSHPVPLNITGNNDPPTNSNSI